MAYFAIRNNKVIRKMEEVLCAAGCVFDADSIHDGDAPIYNATIVEVDTYPADISNYDYSYIDGEFVLTGEERADLKQATTELELSELQVNTTGQDTIFANESIEAWQRSNVVTLACNFDVISNTTAWATHRLCKLPVAPPVVCSQLISKGNLQGRIVLNPDGTVFLQPFTSATATLVFFTITYVIA